MNEIAEDIKDLLEGDGIGVFASTKDSEWSIQTTEEPPTPNNTITIYNTGGRLLKYHDVAPKESPTFQLRVRGPDTLTTSAKLEQCCVALRRRGLFTLNGAKYKNIFQDGLKIPLAKDGNGRFIWVANFTAFRENDPDV